MLHQEYFHYWATFESGGIDVHPYVHSQRANSNHIQTKAQDASPEQHRAFETSTPGGFVQTENKFFLQKLASCPFLPLPPSFRASRSSPDTRSLPRPPFAPLPCSS
ncbi:hypothetical protein EVAR_18357_1 [Eumeta japonica]|uniref:Uncharacterized protein n=1 Tax=Eumeta variegata TaxID=151549 RepID=A0A4C1V8N6_EUMVA|nr:hypothetical protein EVAR_18357_1 [Eumeta japonica]